MPSKSSPYADPNLVFTRDERGKPCCMSQDQYERVQLSEAEKRRKQQEKRDLYGYGGGYFSRSMRAAHVN